MEGGQRAAVKQLTRAIEYELLRATVNAPDWYVSSKMNYLFLKYIPSGTPFMLPEWRVIYCGKKIDPSTLTNL